MLIFSVFALIAISIAMVPEIASASTIAALNAPITESKSALKTNLVPIAYIAALIVAIIVTFSPRGGVLMGTAIAFVSTAIFVVLQGVV